MPKDEITTTRSQIAEAFRRWDAQARAEGWPDNPDAEASADHFINLLRDQRA